MKGLSSVGNGMELRVMDDMTLEVCQSSKCSRRMLLAEDIFGQEWSMIRCT